MTGAIRSLPALLAGYAPAPEMAVTGLALNSRRVATGGLFMACRGTQRHGLEFLDMALANGAGVIAWEPAPGVAPPSAPVPVIAVENLSRVAGHIAARYFGEPSASLHVSGVTGTDGKTSTANLIAQASETLGARCLYIGTLGIGRPGEIRLGDHTTPDAVTVHQWLAEALAQGCTAVAMEVSSHALDQARVAGVRFDAAVLTNLGRDHLDYHGDEAAYAAAKRRLFEAAPRVRIFNADDATGRRWAGEFADAISFGVSAPPLGVRSLRAKDLDLHPAGLRFTVHDGAASVRIDSPLLGRFNVDNLLAALAVLVAQDVPLDDAAAALSAARTVPGRMEGFDAPGAPLVIVDYAHTPQALASVLAAARAHTRGKLICVFGCGGDRDRGKRPLMARAAAAGADALILTDDNPRGEDPASIIQDMRAGLAGTPHEVIHDRAAAIRAAIAMAGADDVIVIAGKGHEDYQIYGNERRSFSDRAFVAAELGLEPRP